MTWLERVGCDHCGSRGAAVTSRGRHYCGRCVLTAEVAAELKAHRTHEVRMTIHRLAEVIGYSPDELQVALDRALERTARRTG